MKRYILLTGAMKNFGDFLIVDRAKRLLREHRPDVELVDIPRWNSLEDRLDEVNKADAVILCGGPAYHPAFYPGIYPLTKNTDEIKPPIIPLGLGWYDLPGDSHAWARFEFTPSSLRLLQRIHSECAYSGCRDYLTKSVLRRNGFNNVLMTGDPAWYDIANVLNDFEAPEKVKHVLFSLPQNQFYFGQCLQSLEQVRKVFPDAKLTCAFHRGIEADQYTSQAEAKGLQDLKSVVEERCDEVVNLAYDLEGGIEYYRGIDLHVGYRLHAHILSLSFRKPSFIVEEDGRGRGCSEALGLRGIPAAARRPIGNIVERHWVPGKARRAAHSRGWTVMARTMTAQELGMYLYDEAENGFLRFRGLEKVFQGHYEIMKKYLDSLP